MTGIKDAIHKITHSGHNTPSDRPTSPVSPKTTGSASTDAPRLNADGTPESASQRKKREKEEAKAKLKAEKEQQRLAREAEQKEQARLRREEKEKAEAAAEENEEDYAAQNYGKLPLLQSQERPRTQRTSFRDINASKDGERVIFRARLQTSRAQGAKMVFLVFRQQADTVQAIIQVQEGKVSRRMVRWAEAVNPESICLVEGRVQKSPEEIKSTTVHDAEIIVEKLHIISEAPQTLPFPILDASRPHDIEGPSVALDTRLDNRVLDLRTITNQAVFRIQSGVGNLFREYLNSQGFVEIHTPKLQGAATESGASVFKVGYFKGQAFLAQSPQLAKQMAIAADFEKVYEIAPVFRAEDSNTHRHLTEFVGLDLEMAFEEHYHEAMETIDAMFKTIFKGLQERYAHDIEVIQKQFPHESFTWLDETLVLKYSDAIKLLQEAGVQQGEPPQLIGDYEDMSTASEKALGQIVKEKYKTDYYIVDKFPLAIRPFYTMPDPSDNRLSNSYDFFMRGEEIMSGAQRIHDADFLASRIKEAGIDPADMKHYIDAFRLGCPPHAGGGIGLERVVMLFLKLNNIRRSSMFPRDPKRLEP